MPTRGSCSCSNLVEAQLDHVHSLHHADLLKVHANPHACINLRVDGAGSGRKRMLVWLLAENCSFAEY